MSYLSGPRLVFAGDFQADVSTVNNDVRHYDTADFEERFQLPREGNIQNGWWNPIGSGAYRLVNCRVQGVSRADGTWIDDPAKDGAVGLFVANALDSPAGKLVDLDPQWQMASMIWGLTVRITDGKSPGQLIGRFEPAPFRDLSQRQFTGAPNGQPLSSYFQSVLTGLAWDLGTGISSPVLEELRAAAKDGLLSIILTTFGYYARPGTERFTVGRVVGALGVAKVNEPRGFVLGRRFAPAKTDNNDPDTTPEGVNYFTAVVDEDRGTITADLGNALPILDPMGSRTQDLGELVLGVLTTPDSNGPNGPTFVAQGAVLGPEGYVAIGTLPYLRPDWLTKTAGIVTFTLDEKARALVGNHPLALLQPLARPGQARVLIRETILGYYVRADDFEHRLNPGAQAPGQVAPTDSVTVHLYASQYGKPLDHASIATTLAPPMPGQGGGPGNEIDAPKAPIPLIGTPAEALSLPGTVTTGPSGRAELPLTARSPNTPRKYLDGQIYVINYNLSVVANWQIPQQHSLDGIYLHVRDAFTPPELPTWEDDIRPILEQYGNLYPVMSRRLVNLGDYSAMAEHRDILELAFSRDIEDSNYMPATRDLSPAKLAMILQWLRERGPDGGYVLARGPRFATAAKAAASPLVEKTETPPTVTPEASQMAGHYHRLGLIKGRGTGH